MGSYNSPLLEVLNQGWQRNHQDQLEAAKQWQEFQNSLALQQARNSAPMTQYEQASLKAQADQRAYEQSRQQQEDSLRGATAVQQGLLLPGAQPGQAQPLPGVQPGGGMQLPPPAEFGGVAPGLQPKGQQLPGGLQIPQPGTPQGIQFPTPQVAGPSIPGQTYQLGGQPYHLNPDYETKGLIPWTPPKDLQGQLGSDPLYITPDKAMEYGLRFAEQQAKSIKPTALKPEEVESKVKDIHRLVDPISKNMAGLFEQQMRDAARKDASTGQNTQVTQTDKSIESFLMQHDPEIWKTEMSRKTAEAASAKYAEADANWRYNQTHVDSASVDAEADMIAKAGGDSMVYNEYLKLHSKLGAPYQEALASALAKRNINPVQLSNRAREAGQLSKDNLPHVNKLLGMIDDPKFQSKLGVAASRWNDFLAGKLGAGDPDYAELRSFNKMNNSAVALIHMGQRGAASESGRQYMESIAGGGKMDATTLREGVKALKEWMEGYASNFSEKSPLLNKNNPMNSSSPHVMSDQEIIDALKGIGGH